MIFLVASELLVVLNGKDEMQRKYFTKKFLVIEKYQKMKYNTINISMIDFERRMLIWLFVDLVSRCMISGKLLKARLKLLVLVSLRAT